MKTIGYIRVSDDKQNSGAGPAQQRDSILAWALSNGVKISEWVLEAKTGTTGDREHIQSLLTRAKASEFQRLVIDRVDRLGRVASVSLTLKDAFEEAGVEVVFAADRITDDAQGKLVFTLLSGIAEFQRTKLLQHMGECRVAAVRTKGRYPGGRVPPFGYRSVGDGKLAIDPDSARAVVRMFMFREIGCSPAQISAQLAAEGILNSAGNPFAPVFIRKILAREAVYRAQAAPGSTSLAPGVRPLQPAILSA